MQCRIQFLHSDLQQFHWCKLDDSGTSDSGIAELDDLKTVCANAGQVTVFLPQQKILMTSEKLPAKASKQQLNAIAFAVEEKLADDIENCFFATLPQQEDSSVPVAVIEREIMQNCVLQLAQQHVNALMIVPQMYLCPWPEDDDLLASVCPDGDGFVVRYGEHAGLFCQSELLVKVLSLLEKQQSLTQTRVDVYADLDFEEQLPGGLDIHFHPPVDLLSQPFNQHTCLNLKQKEFQSSHQWLELLKQWKWPVAAILLLGLVFFANDLFNLWKKDQVYSELIAEQQSLLSQYVPDLKPGNQPKKQLIKLLAENQRGAGEAGFLDLLHEYAQLKTGFNAVNTSKVLYQQSQLVVSLESKELNSLEEFRNKLNQSKFSTEIENVNINPDKTTARLVMRAPE